MYRNLHGSGDLDAEVDDICTTLRGSVYRITANNTLKFQTHREIHLWPIFGLKTFYL